MSCAHGGLSPPLPGPEPAPGAALPPAGAGHTQVWGCPVSFCCPGSHRRLPPRPARLPQQRPAHPPPRGSTSQFCSAHRPPSHYSYCFFLFGSETLALRPQPFPGAIFFLPDGRLSLWRCRLFLWTLMANWGPFSSFFVKRFLLGCMCPILEPEGTSAECSVGRRHRSGLPAQLGPSRVHVTDSLSSPPAAFDASMDLFHF